MSHSVNVACRLLCESCIHGLILLAFALIASRLLRRSSAAIRCLVWQTAAGLMLLLPIISSILPGRNITVPALPGRIVSVFADPTPVQDQPIMAAAVDINVAAQAAIPQTLLNASSPTVSDRSSSEPVPASLRNLPSSLSALPLRLPSSLFVLLLWAGVMALLAFEVVIGHVRLHGLRRRCVAVEAGPIMDLTVEICTRLGIRRRITLLQTPHTMPMAWGWLSPVVLLPTEAIGWPTNRIELVLLHELAHIRRGDWPMQRFARVLCCLYWFHPMAWICLSQMKRAGEEACDDVVLSSGVQAPEYAAQLLEVVRMMRLNVPIHRGHDPASVAMAQPAHIHDRLRTILEPMRSRTGVRRSTVLAAAAATLCIVPLGSLHVFAQSTAPASSQPGTPDAASYNHKEQSTAATANAKSSADQEASRARELSAKLKQQAALIAKQQHEIATLRRAAEMARAESQDRALMLEKLKKQQAEISARSAEMNAANARLERDAEKLAAQRESLSKRLGAGERRIRRSCERAESSRSGDRRTCRQSSTDKGHVLRRLCSRIRSCYRARKP